MTLLYFSSLAGLEVARLIRSGQLGKGSHQKKKTTKFWTLSEKGGGVSAAAKLFIDEQYGHVYRGGVGAPRPN